MGNKGIGLYEPPTFDEEMSEGKSLEDGLSGSKRMYPDPHKVLNRTVRPVGHNEENQDDS